MRAWSILPIGLVAAGLGLVALALAQDGASVAIVLVVPVLYGRSLEFVAGALLFIAGLFTLPLAFGTVVSVEDGPSVDDEPTGSAGSGGVVLIGPVPIVWGSWKDVSTRTRVLLAAVGGGLLVALVVLFLWRPA